MCPPSTNGCSTACSAGKTKSSSSHTVRRCLKKAARKEPSCLVYIETSMLVFNRVNSSKLKCRSKHPTVGTSGCGSRSPVGKATSFEGLSKMSLSTFQVSTADKLSKFGKETSLTIFGIIQTNAMKETSSARLYGR